MDREKLMKMASAVRTGGKDCLRRKKKAVHKTTTDNKGLQSTLKRIGVNVIPAIEEVNIFKDDVVIQFLNPKVQASIAANTWVISGAPQTKKRSAAIITSTKATSSRTTRLDALERKWAELEERQRVLEVAQKRGGSLDAEDLRRTMTILESLSSRVSILETKVAGSSTKLSDEGRLEELKTQLVDMQTTISEIEEECRGAVSVLWERLEEVDTKTNLTTRILATQLGAAPSSEYNRFKLPEPKHYRGVRDVTELENFLFDIEQYFRVIRVDSEDVKVFIASMYLSGDAKLWWRTKCQEVQDERCKIDSWEDLKRELKNHFLPENVAYLARKQLRRLTQTGTIYEYIMKFSSLMLNIRNMTEQDQLFYFMDGLQPWVQNELQRQMVQDLPSAKAAAKQLLDYSSDCSQSKRPLPMSGGNGNGNKKSKN